MPPRKKPPAASTSSVPPPNPSHPSASLIPPALASPTRAHPPAYHSFLRSPFFPPPDAGAAAAAPAGRKRKAAAGSGLVPCGPEGVEAGVMHAKLLGWFEGVREARGMPWRKEVDVKGLKGEERTQRGYEVWVSETMLQQTQVATVIPYFERWMARFPTVAALAASDIEDINAVWAGLGYYSRASRLLAGAKTVMRDFKGKMPGTAAELEGVDGIGPYTAGAVSSIAFGQRSAMVDGNVIRVLSRLTAMHAPQMAKASQNFIWAVADLLVPAYDADLAVGGPNKCGAWGQAVMELGATVCTPKAPSCGACPLSEECLAYNEVRTLAHLPAAEPAPIADVEDLCELCEPARVTREVGVALYPMAKERKKPREEETAVCVLEWEQAGEVGKERKVLIVKRPEKGLLAGLFEFPSVDLPPSDEPSTAPMRRRHLEKAVHSLLAERLPAFQPPNPATPSADPSSPNLRVLSLSDLGAITQVYSHQKRDYHILRVVLSSPTLPALAPPRTRAPRETDLVQSQPGRARWVEAGGLEGANLGGAMLKVLEVRNQGVKGRPMGKRVRVGGGKGGQREVGQGGLGGWLVGAQKGAVAEEGEVEADEVKAEPLRKRKVIVISSEED